MQKIVDELGCTITNEKVMRFLKQIADGAVYFTEILPDVSVEVVDVVLQKNNTIYPRKIRRGIWIIYYDLSYSYKLGFRIVDNQISSSYDAKIDEAYSFRLFIRKSAIKAFVEKEKIEKLLKKNFY